MQTLLTGQSKYDVPVYVDVCHWLGQCGITCRHIIRKALAKPVAHFIQQAAKVLVRSRTVRVTASLKSGNPAGGRVCGSCSAEFVNRELFDHQRGIV